jgi:GH15 family glucan-1,4-alpha-glucosidase
MSSPLEDYALIGDGKTAALVGKDGSIDWLCWPRFDSDACFAALLGSSTNGRWIIAAVAPSTTRRSYREDTLILETDHFCETGVARVIDFMPSLERRGAIIRVIQGIAGTVPMRMELSPRGNYGAVPPWFERERDSFVGRVGECRFIADGTINGSGANLRHG